MADLKNFIELAQQEFQTPRLADESSIERFLESSHAQRELSPADFHKLVIFLAQAEIRRSRENGHSPSAQQLAARFLGVDQSVFEELISLPEIPREFKRLAIFPERYQLLEKIGIGGTGEVWRAFDDELERSVAIKLLRADRHHEPSAIHRLERESMMTGNLQHPGIPPIFERGRTRNGSPYFSMKLVEGNTLAQLLRLQTHDLPFLLGVFQSVAQTIGYSHAQQTIHRDLKPQNIMVGEFGEVQVMDWGMAKSLSSPQVESASSHPKNKNGESQAAIDTVTTTDSCSRKTSGESGPERSRELNTKHGDVLGTPAYMAPEQARGELESLGAATDVFALGVILFELLTQQRLHQHSTADETLQLLRKGKLDSANARLIAAEVDAGLIEICTGCLQIDPKDRPRDAGVVADSIADYQFSVQRRLKQAELDRSAVVVRSAEQRKRARLTLIMSSLIALGSLIGAAAFAFQWNKAVKSERNANREAETRQEVNDFLILDFLGSLDSNDRLGNDLSAAIPDVELTVREVLDRAAKKVSARFSNRPDIEWEIRKQLGSSYIAVGDTVSARVQFEAALDLLEKDAESDDSDYWSLRHDLVEVAMAEADYETAFQTMTELCLYTEQTEGVDSDSALITRGDLSSVLNSMARFHEAEAVIRDVVGALEEKKRTAGDNWEDSVGLNAARIKLATVLLELSEIEEAELILRQVISELSNVVSDVDGELSVTGNVANFRDYTNATQQLTQVYEIQGKMDEAEAMRRLTLERYQEMYGPKHPISLRASWDWTICLLRMGEAAKAKNLLTGNLETLQEIYPADHEWVLETRDTLAAALTMLKDYELAEDLFLENRVALKSTKPLPELDLTANSNNLGSLYLSVKRFEEAEPLFVEAVEILRRIRGASHPDTVRTLSNLAKCRRELGNFKLAIENYKDALKDGREVLESTHPEIVLTTKDLAMTYLKNRQPKKALGLLQAFISENSSNLEFAKSKEFAELQKIKSLLSRKLEND